MIISVHLSFSCLKLKHNFDDKGKTDVALIQCWECGRDVSSQAPSCPNCGAPVQPPSSGEEAPEKVSVSGDCFMGTKPMLVKLAVKAIQSLNYKVDSVDDTSGLVAFTTGITWGSWSGVSGSIYIEEVSPNRFFASGNAKQNVKGGQVVALNLFGEAAGKVNNVIEEMRRLTPQ